MKVAIITAGGAGMFCGSCMQDNTLARTLQLAGVDAVLVPTYTPIRVEEEDVSSQRVFLGGINVYLDSTVPGWRFLPAWMTGWLNRPGIIKRLSQYGSTDAKKLGALTLDMLNGTAGPQQREVEEFTEYICQQLKPDVVLFSNALLSGTVASLRAGFAGKILCMLQGDDVFLEALTKRWKPRVMARLRENCRLYDGFLTHTTYYRNFMSDYLDVPTDLFKKIPLTVDVDGIAPEISPNDVRPQRTTIGYFARICPEKGIQNLLQAAEDVLPDFPEAEVVVAGYLAKEDKRWFHSLLKKTEARLPGRIRWLGSPSSRAQKFAIIESFDFLCVPTEYLEPKGLYVLEAALAGVAAILPSHGAFPELVAELGVGRLYDSCLEHDLADAVRQAISGPGVDRSALPGRVREVHGMHATAETIRRVISEF